MNKLNDKPMRILERVQSFLDISYIEIFFHFPHIYVVCKLSYSQGENPVIRWYAEIDTI